MYKVYGGTTIGEGTVIGEGVVIGHPGRPESHLSDEKDWDQVKGALIGSGCNIRSNSIIYSGAVLADGVKTGHYILVREDTRIGENTLVGTGTVIEDQCTIGKKCSLQTGVYVPTYSVIEEGVFLGPNVVLTNDKNIVYPLRERGMEYVPAGPRICAFARIGANSTILPGVTVGRNALVGAGSVLTKDVEENAKVWGNPARKVGEVEPEYRL